MTMTIISSSDSDDGDEETDDDEDDKERKQQQVNESTKYIASEQFDDDKYKNDSMYILYFHFCEDYIFGRILQTL
mgnify:CR=1 FL=1